MPTKLKGYWNITNLFNITKESHPNRFDYAKRDVIKSAIRIVKVKVYDGKQPGLARTKFEIFSSSFPQYEPYYTVYDSRGRIRAYQRTYKHQYKVTIQMDELTVRNPIKLRTGQDFKYNFNPNPSSIKSKSNPNGRYLSVADYNIEVNGINPDFFFTNSWVRHEEDCLVGKNYANGAPLKSNPFLLPFLTKHEIVVLETLLNYGIFLR
jgi:hypothetical protein